MTDRLHLSKQGLWIIPLALSLAACATMSPQKPQLVDEMRRTLDQAADETARGPQAPAEVPSAVEQDLLPPIAIDLPGAEPAAEQRFDVQVSNAPAREFFMGLVSGTPINMVVHPEVGGRVSLDLKNVTVQQVMATVRSVYGYEYRLVGGGYQVMPARMRSRIFQVNYLNLRRVGRSETSVSSGQVSEKVSSTGGDNGDSTTKENVPSSHIQTETSSDFWSELRQSLEVIVGSEGGRSVVLSPQSGVIVVRAMPAELREVENFLSRTQDIMQRQVILEAKILEIELSDGFQSGVNWAKLARDGTDTYLASQTGGGSFFENQFSEISGATGVLDPGALSQVQGTSTSAFGGVFSLALNLGSFNAFIELLGTQGNVQVLSSPRVSTVNNQKAVIKVGSDEFFVTGVSSTTTSSSTTSSSSPEIELTPFFSGIALDVTPQIAEDGEVILHIHPSVSEVKDQTKNITVAGQPQSLPLAFSSVRESDSIVRARSGQVVVIGGLMENKIVDDAASTPFLGDIPLIGALFRHNKRSSRKSELVILLRPVVADAQGVARDLRDTSRRLEALRAPAARDIK